MSATKNQTLKGFRDFLPSQMAVRNAVRKICIDTFELFGFQPLETPTLEYSSVLTGKYGDEADKLIYTFTDKGGRQVGLKYDLTVPTARVLSSYNLPLPFKRYQIQPVFRADNTQKGRYREFLQCDVDCFGYKSPVVDAEIITIIFNILEKLNFKKYSIRINNRELLKNIPNTVLQTIDKLGKIGESGVKDELKSKGIQDDEINKTLDYIKTVQPDDYLKKVFEALEKFGVPKTAYTFDPTMIRGLDYYTGVIFETYVEEPKVGSITGGGRYDNLVKTLGGPDIPAVGTTMGLDRIVDCILELNLMPEISKTKTKIMLANFGETDKELELLNLLRNNNIPSTYYFVADKLGKQISYADNLGIEYIAIIGENEAKENKVTLKNLKTKEQNTLNSKQIIELFSIS
jgi:histidyl-tRNA synthetase